MRISFLSVILLLLLVINQSCEERFEPALNPASQSLIVVDGMISNMPGPYTVRLSISSKVENPEYVPLSGFYVEIEDNTGIKDWLNETSPGTYVTGEQGIQGIPGRKYRLLLTSPDGQKYASAFETLREPAEIASITYQPEIHYDDDLIYDIYGYRFYVSSEVAPTDSTYFMWRLVSTYKYRSDFNIYWYFDGSLHRVYDTDSLKTCYRTDTLPEFYLFNTEGLETPLVQDYPLNYVSILTRELMERYSLLVKQFTISKDAYEFWRIVREQNKNLGDLYSKQPFQTRGNIYNTEDPEEIVLGYFMVAGVSEKRTFAGRPPATIRMRYPVCILGEDQYGNFGAIFEFPSTSWPVFATRGPDGNALPNQWCMDCRESGGVIEKPDFWID